MQSLRISGKAVALSTRKTQGQKEARFLGKLGLAKKLIPSLAQALKSAVSRVSAPSAVVASQPGWALTVCEVC